MGGKGSGPRSDLAKWRQAARLRKKGLSLAAIASRIDMTAEGVRRALCSMGVSRPDVTDVRCRECDRVVTRGVEATRRACPPWCLRCLKRHPEASLGDRVKSHRLTAGMTQEQLGDRTGLHKMTVSWIERGETKEPGWRTLARLVAVLGAGVLLVPMPE
jgi:transcriptional regulator with XRE-family HTH domain